MENTHNRHIYIDKWRFILMILGAISFMGFPSQYNLFIKVFLSFAAPTFYILSGYLVMRKSEHRSERILSAIKKTAIVFAILSASYFALNFVMDFGGTLKTVTTGKFWIDFLVLNIFALPIGGHLWYVQALLYGYIILYFIDKLKLLKFDLVIIGLCFVAAFVSGDLSGVIGFNFMGHEYLMGNFITRAIPYILIGKRIHDAKYHNKKANIKNIVVYMTVGILLLSVEAAVLASAGQLVYYGHLVGHIFMAVSAAAFICSNRKSKFNLAGMKDFSTYGTNWIYYIAQPMFTILNTWMVGEMSDAVFLSGFLAVASIVFSIGIVLWVHKIVKS